MQLLVYIHRHATIVETSRHGVLRQEMPRCRFTFRSLADVRAFWITLHNESLNTPAGLLWLLLMLIMLMSDDCNSGNDTSKAVTLTKYTCSAFNTMRMRHIPSSVLLIVIMQRGIND